MVFSKYFRFSDGFSEIQKVSEKIETNSEIQKASEKSHLYL
jgi:hypothetical protein